jgi:pimeloyl-ACP methyl ester carboxylesterase
MELALRDGRVLGIEEYGDPNGTPVFFFHGIPSCRLEAAPASDAARLAAVRLIAVDRPGFGLSSFHSYRPLARFTDDIGELADQLSARRFAAVGVSGGAPFALATAAMLPERVSAVATVGGFFVPPGPDPFAGMSRELRASLWLARRAPWLARPLFAVTARAVRRSDGRQFVRALAKRMPAPDRELLRDPEVQSLLIGSFREAFAGGARGAAWEQRLLVRDWGFATDSLKAPLTVWQGSLDRNAPRKLGQSLAAAVPGARLELREGEGHLSLIHDRMEEVLRDLARFA